MKIKEISFENIENVSKLILSNNQVFNNDINLKNLKISYKYLILNLPLLATLNEYKINIDKKYLMLDNFSNDILYHRFTLIYEHLIDLYNDATIIYDLRYHIWYGINFINNFALKYCKEYQFSLDMENIVKTVEHDEIKKIINEPLDKRFSVVKIENQIKEIRERLLDKLSTLDIPENQFKNLIKLKLINEGQLGHLLLKIGFRTDLSDKTISKIIDSNYLNGLTEDIDLIAESLSDKKSKLYNKLLMPLTQYSNRKQQLSSFNLKYIYDGDCGTDKYVEFFITEKNATATIGKYIINDNNKLTLITKNNLKKYINTVVKIRSPLTCLYKNGTCEVCGGKLTKFYMNRFFNIGHSGVLIFTNKTSQGVLSNKHYQTTTSKEYVIPENLKKYFIKIDRFICIKNTKMYKHLKIGFDIKDARKLLNISDIKYFDDRDDIFEYNFGVYKSIYLKLDDQVIINKEPLQYFNIFPKLSKDFIIYLLNNPDMITNEYNKLYIDLSKYKKKSIFNVSVLNFSIKSFYDSIENFSKKVIGKFNNINIALNEFSNIIYERSDINLIYVELILKSFMITNTLDKGLPNVENIKDNDAHFSFIKDINMYRGLATSLAFERHGEFLRSPEYYLVPKQLNPLDIFLNLNL